MPARNLAVSSSRLGLSCFSFHVYSYQLLVSGFEGVVLAGFDDSMYLPLSSFDHDSIISGSSRISPMRRSGTASIRERVFDA